MKITENRIEKARKVLHGRETGTVKKGPNLNRLEFATVQFTHKNKPIEARFYKKQTKKQWELDYIAEK